MRILFITPVSETGGSDQALLRMVRDLAPTADCHVVVPRPSPLSGAFREAGATLHVVPMRRITTDAGVGWWLGYAAEWPMAVA